MRFLTADDRFLVILLTMVLWEGERFCDALFCAERATHQSIRLCGCAREQRNHRTQAADVASQRLGSLVVQKDKNVLAATQPTVFIKIEHQFCSNEAEKNRNGLTPPLFGHLDCLLHNTATLRQELIGAPCQERGRCITGDLCKPHTHTHTQHSNTHNQRLCSCFLFCPILRVWH